MALAGLVRVLRIVHRARQELRTPSSERHLEAVAVRELDQLPGDVRKARLVGRIGLVAVAFPVAIGRVRIARCGRSMRNPRGGDDTGRHTPVGSTLQDGLHAVGSGRTEISTRHTLIHRDQAVVGFDTGHDRTHGWRRIRGLLVRTVGFGKRHVRKFFERKLVFLTEHAVLLAFQNARRGHRGDAHAVAKEKDDISGVPQDGFFLLGFFHRGAAIAEPFFRRLRARSAGLQGQRGGNRCNET